MNLTYHKKLNIKTSILGLNFNIIIKAMMLAYFIYAILSIFKVPYALVIALVFGIWIMAFTIILIRYYDPDIDQLVEVSIKKQNLFHDRFFD